MAKKQERLEELRAKGRAKQAKALEIRVKTMKETKDYNLGTSLRSYIDPRVFHRWGEKVEFDWKSYYAKTLQRKFAWVDDRESVS